MSDNYYKDLWNNPNTEAGQFFNKVNFNSKEYQLQEHIFKQTLWSINNMRKWGNQEPISTVLEVGAGTGRMTKIMLEELPDIEKYYIVDIKAPIKELTDLFPRHIEVGIAEHDIIGKEFDLLFRGKQYDMILASEVFMHIKPEDIDSVLTRLTNLLAPEGIIINIDWYHQKEPSEWCYIHDYEKMYRENGLYPVFMRDINRQKLFCYGK
jgi:2-polyprenyl-3-methyl-5-hydroxy-6-metoxy-1,4-benzoquinol methylase